jgi:hypothetical protein
VVQGRNPQLLVSLAAMTNGRIAASGGSAPVFKGDDWWAPWNFRRHFTAG